MEKSRLDTRLQDLIESTFESALTKQSTTSQEVLSPLHLDIEITSKTNPSPRSTEHAYDSFRRSTYTIMAFSYRRYRGEPDAEAHVCSFLNV